jgi:hypothetical protein
MIGVIIASAASVAANAALYAAYQRPISLGAVVFCALMFFVTVIAWARS